MNVNLSLLRKVVPLPLLVLLLLGAGLVHAQAATLTVNAATGTIHTGDACPNPRSAAVYLTIQAAINCAAEGDTLQIGAGTYLETLNLAKSLMLQGANATTTIINGGGLGRVLTVNAATNVSLAGLTLTNGNAVDGGGIFTLASTLNIANSKISSNVATHQGGGLLTQAGTVTLTNTQVTGNSAPDGGGIFTQGGTVTLHNSSVSGNSATGAGGGIFTQAGSLTGEGTVANNTAGADADIHTIVGAVVIVPSLQGNISATVVLQGRPAAPDARWSVTLQVTITPHGDSTPVFDNTITTDQLGAFALSGFAPGAYDIRVKGAHTLSNVRTVTLLVGPNTLNLGTLREGDTDGNNLINLTDFSLLATTFGKQQGNPGYDGRADFNGDTVINLLDFSLLATNFGQLGEGFGGAEAPLLPTESSGDGTLVPLPTALPPLPTDDGSIATLLPPPTAEPTAEPPTLEAPTAESPTLEPPTAMPTATELPGNAQNPPSVTDEAPL